MFDQATVRTGIRYGVINGICGFLIIVLIYLGGGDPYGHKNLISYLIIPVFIILGLNHYKSYRMEAVGFAKAFLVAFSITLYTALTSAMLLYVFAVLVGPEVLQRHIVEMKALMDLTRNEAVRMVGQEAFDQAYADLSNRSPFQLANEDFMRRIFFGLVVSVVAAFLKRK